MKLKMLNASIAALLCMTMVMSGCAKKSNTDVQPPAPAPAATEETPASAETEAPTAEAPAADETQGSSAGSVVEAKTTILEYADPSKANPAKTRENADTFIIGMTALKMDLLPIFYSTTYDHYAVNLIFSKFLTNDEKGNVITDDTTICDKYELSDDQKTITYTLKKDVKFSDGSPLTAKDVEFTYTLLCDPSYGDRYTGAVDNLVGYEEYMDEAAGVQSVEGIKVIDDNTISFTYKVARVDNLLNMLDVSVMPKSVYDVKKGDVQSLRDKMAKTEELVGAGPFKVSHYQPQQYIEMTYNENYFGKEPKIKDMIIKFTTQDTQMQELEAGVVDGLIQIPVTVDSMEKVKAAGVANIAKYPANAYSFLAFNMKNDKFKDLKVRQALVYGFNRKAFVQMYYGDDGIVCNQPTSLVSWAYAPEVNTYDYDPAKAEQMLDEAGWIKGADGIREKDGQKMTIAWDTYTDNKFIETMIPMLKADWLKIGVKVEPNLMDFNAMIDKVFNKQEFELTGLSWAMGIDPADNLTTFGSEYSKLGDNNMGSFNDPETDALLKSGLTEFDHAKRVEIYQKFMVRINEQLPYIFVGNPQQLDVFNTRVKNFSPSPFCDWTFSIFDIELEK